MDGRGADPGSMSPARVKEEPESTVTDHLDLVLVKEEAESVDEEVCVKEECEDSTGLYGVSEAAMLAGLYTKHEVKDELVLGPEQRVRASVSLLASSIASSRGRSWTELERLMVDAEPRTCRVGRRTYELHTTEPGKPVTTTHNTQENFDLDQQQMLHKTMKPYKCSDRVFESYKSESDFRNHALIHKSEKRFRYSHCDYKTSSKINLQNHQAIHTGHMPFKCNYCDYKCKYISKLRVHETTHSEHKLFRCYHCDYQCDVKKDLQIHMMKHTNKKLLKCSFCDFKSYRFQITHNGEKRFKCNYCDYKSHLKSILQHHKKIHTVHELFKCDHCDYKCNNKTRLRVHLMIHTGEKPFECKHCKFRTRNKSDLRNHEMTHTVGKHLLTLAVGTVTSNAKAEKPYEIIEKHTDEMLFTRIWESQIRRPSDGSVSDGSSSAGAGSLSRDEEWAKAMGIPMEVHDIINLPMNKFNEQLSKHDFSEAQMTLLRDIRRRGKNKVAAQNCRKRKLDQITSLADEVRSVRDRKVRTQRDHHALTAERQRVKERFAALYRHVFKNLRDAEGRPLSSAQYSLQQAADGNVVLVPKMQHG